MSACLRAHSCSMAPLVPVMKQERHLSIASTGACLRGLQTGINMRRQAPVWVQRRWLGSGSRRLRIDLCDTWRRELFGDSGVILHAVSYYMRS